jgi:MFS family permease
MSTSLDVEPADEPPSYEVRNAVAAHLSNVRLWSKEYGQLLIIQFTFGLGFSTFYLLPKYLRQIYGANAAAIGKVTGVALLAAVATAPIAAAWVARGRRRAPAVAGLVMLAASALTFAFVGCIGWLMLLLRVAQGAAFTLFTTTIVTKVAEIVPSRRLSQGIGYLGLASLITNALSPVIAEPFAETLGWPAVFGLAALWCVAAAIGAWHIEDVASGPVTPRVNFGAAWSVPLRGIFYAAMICGVALGVMFTYAQPLALQRGAHRVGSFFFGYAVLAAGVRVLVGNAADLIGRRKVSVFATAAYAFVLLLSARVEPSTLFWSGAGLGFAHGLLYPALNALAFEMSDASTRGVVAAAFTGAFSLGYALSVMTLGYVADAWGLPSIFVATALLAATGILGLVKWPRSKIVLPPNSAKL